MTDINHSGDTDDRNRPTTKKPLWRRRWAQIVAGMIVLLLVVVLLLPTVASMGFVRSIVVGKINNGLDGRVEIDDWSLGWNHGATLHGVRFFNMSGQKLISIDKLSTPISLIGAARGNLNIGRTIIEGLDCDLNLQGNTESPPKETKHATKTSSPASSQPPTNLPNINGQIVLEGKVKIEGEGFTGQGDSKGELTIKSDRSSNALSGQLALDNAQFSGSALSGDVIKTNLTIPLDISRQIQSDGNTKITIKSMDVLVPQLLDASVRGEVSQQALENILAKKSPGQVGTLDLSFKVPNLEAVAVQFSKAISLQPGVTITGGELVHLTHLDIREKDVAVTNRLSFSAQGTRNGEPIKIDNLEVSKADATFDPTRDGLAGLANVAIDIQSPFLSAKGGSTPSGLDLPGTINLDRLNEQLARFIDLKDVKLSGTGDFRIRSTGDTASVEKMFDTHIDVGLKQFALTLSNGSTIQWASLALISSAKVDLNARRIEHADVSLQTGDGKNNVIDDDFHADGIDLASSNVKRFDNRLTVMDLSTAQQQIDPFVSALRNNDLHFTAGQVYATVSGSVEGKTRTIKFDKSNPLNLSTPNLTIQKGDGSDAIDLLHDEKIIGLIDGEVSFPEKGPLLVNVRTFNVTTEHKLFAISKSEGTDLTFKLDDNSIGGGGQLALSADAKVILDIVRHLNQAPAPQPNSAGQLTSGQVEATLALSHGTSPETVIALNGALKNISVTTADPKKPMVNETVNFAMQVNAKDDMSGGSATGKIDSAFANLDLKQAKLTLNAKGQPIDSAEIEAAAPDLAKLYAVYVAFSPPSTPNTTAPPSGKKPKKGQPAPTMPPEATPIQITNGSATFALSITRNPSADAKTPLIAAIIAHGLITVPEVDAGGLETKNLLLPLAMKGGVLRTVYFDKPEGQNKAPAATCNGGTLDFSNVTCDLRADTPRLTIQKNQRIVLHVSINPLLGDTLGKFVNPVFAKSKRAAGALDVTVADCQNLALGDKMKTAESGKLRIGFSLSDMDIANPMGSLLLGGILKQLKIPSPPSDDADTFRGSIRDGIVSIDKGVANTDITLLLVDPSAADEQTTKKKSQQQAGAMPLRFWGDVHLEDLTQSLNATIPTGLIGKFVGSIPLVKIKDPSKALASVFPKGIPVTVKGTTTDPKFDFGDVGKKFGEGLFKNPENLQNIIKQIPKF